MVLVILIVAFLVAFHLGPARFLANRADAQADLLLFLIHLHDAELVLLADLELHRGVGLIHCLGDVAQALDSLGDLDKSSELRRAQNLALDDIANAVLSEERIPDIRLQLLDAERQPAVLGLNTQNDSLHLLALLQDL